jgi:gliding motility-associated-like protein
MNRSLLLAFNSTVEKYSRLDKNIRKSINRGEFWRYTTRKKRHLLHKIERLRRRIAQLKLQVRLAGAGLAAGVMMMSAESSAQTLGPFVQNFDKNPLPKPAFYRSYRPVMHYWDFDNDGDLDVSIASTWGIVESFRNVGTPGKPRFELIYEPGLVASWFYDSNYSNAGRPAYGDLDDDGDQDMLIGQSFSDDLGDLAPDYLYFWRNEGIDGVHDFNLVHYEINPYRDLSYKREGWPALTDFDKDGDLDLIITGEYADDETGSPAWLQFYRNDKVGHAPDVMPTYVRLKGAANNPLYMADNTNYAVSIAFADLDKDGDDDYFYNLEDGTIGYRRNDGGTFVPQSGPYIYNQSNPGASTGNPLEVDNIRPIGYDQTVSFAFADLDNDGDLDLTLGTNTPGTFHAQYIYVENMGNGVMVPDRSHSNPISGFSIGTNSNVSLLDYDNDGDLDMLTSGSVTIPAGETSENVVTHVLFRNDNGTFLEVTENDPFATIEYPEYGKMKAVDTDGDADLDVLVIGRYVDATFNYHYYVDYYQNEGGSYTRFDRNNAANPFHFLELLDPKPSSFEVDFADLDNDQLPDLAVRWEYGPMTFFKNTGEVGKLAITRMTGWETGLESQGFETNPAFIDIDADGDMDLVIGKYNWIWYFENIGSPQLPAWKEYYNYNENEPDAAFEKNPFSSMHFNGKASPDVADIDGDGDRDLIVAVSDGSEGYIEFFENRNPAPLVISGRTNLPFVAGADVILDPDITLSDTDNDQIVLIKVKIEPYDKGLESLQLNEAPPGLGTNWDDEAGELTIFGSGTIATYQAALRAITYRVNGTAPSGRKGQKSEGHGGRTFAKQITITTLDADVTVGPSNTTTFTVTHANDEPFITPGAFNASYNNTPVEIIPAIVLSDPDDILFSSAEVTFITGTYVPGEDRLSVPVNIGGLLTEFDAINGVFRVTGGGSVADFQAILRSLQYVNLAGFATDATPRTLSVKVNDGENDSNLGTVTLTLVAANTPPVLAPASSEVTYSSGNLVLNTALTITDDGPTISSSSVMFTNGFVMGEDKLLFINQNGITGSFNDTTAVLALLGNATLANYEAALRSVEYTNVATTKTTGTRSVSFLVNDGAVNSNSSVVNVSVNSIPPVNTPPTISGAANSFWASGEVIINNTLVLSDADNNDLEGATVTIASGFNVAEDQLLFINQNGITGTTTPGSPTLTLTGTSSVTNYQLALRSIRYRNSSSTPSTADRAFTFTVSDGGTTTTLTGSVIVINKPPDISAPDRKTSAGGNVAFDVSQIFSDPDNNIDLSTLTVSSGNGAQVIIAGGFVTINYGNKPTYEGTDNVTFNVCDTGGRCASSTVTIEVSAEPFVYTGLSPNGDGINDWFHIDFLPEGTGVAVFNRWGDAVWDTNVYDLADPAKRFEGKNKNGTELLAGSYYYKVKLPDGRVKTGHLLLNR